MRPSLTRAAAFGGGAFGALSVLKLFTRSYDVAGGTLTLVVESLVSALIPALLIMAGAILGFGSLSAVNISTRGAILLGGIATVVITLVLDFFAKQYALLHGPVYVAALVGLSVLIAAATRLMPPRSKNHG